jgi:hypothetical protein
MKAKIVAIGEYVEVIVRRNGRRETLYFRRDTPRPDTLTIGMRIKVKRETNNPFPVFVAVDE